MFNAQPTGAVVSGRCALQGLLVIRNKDWLVKRVWFLIQVLFWITSKLWSVYRLDITVPVGWVLNTNNQLNIQVLNKNNSTDYSKTKLNYSMTDISRLIDQKCSMKVKHYVFLPKVLCEEDKTTLSPFSVNIPVSLSLIIPWLHSKKYNNNQPNNNNKNPRLFQALNYFFQSPWVFQLSMTCMDPVNITLCKHEARKMAAEERGSYCTCTGIDRLLPIWKAAACLFLFLYKAGIAECCRC